MQRPFTDILREIRAGALLEELTAELAAMVNAVTDTAKKGTITLKLEVQPMTKADGAVVVVDKVSVSMPKASSGSGTVFFASPEGVLTRRNTKQEELFGGPTLATNASTREKAA